MSALSLLLALASGILAVVALSRISTLTGEVSFLRSLLEQALQRIRQLEKSSQVEAPAPATAADPSFAPERPPVPQPAARIPIPTSLPPPLPIPSYGTHPIPSPDLPVERPGSAVAVPPASRFLASLSGSFQLEQFVGAKLFAWIGGLALFFAAALGLKYSFDHDLFPTWLRATAGFLLGAGLLIGGGWMNRRRYPQTATTLWATGVVILYAVTFACRSLYEFPVFTPPVTFGLMVLVTVLAFTLAVRFESQVVAVLGMLGGFLTPVLISTGRDQALALFSYVAILDLGLIAVAWKRRWDHLPLLAAIGTAILQVGWHFRFFEASKIGVAQGHLILFPFLFGAALTWAVRSGWANRFLTLAASLTAVLGLVLSFPIALWTAQLPGRPLAWFPAVLLCDVALCWIAWIQPAGRRMESIGGSLVFGLLASWTLGHLTGATLWPALGMMLAFAMVHAASPLAWRRLRSGQETRSGYWQQMAPALGVLLAILVIVREVEVGPAYWCVLLLIDIVAVVVATAAGGLVGLLAVLLLTLASAALWVLMPSMAGVDLAESLFVIGGFSLFFVGASSWLLHRNTSTSSRLDADLSRWIPSLSAILPFLLLVMVLVRLRPSNPSPVYALGAVLSVLLLALHRWQRIPSLPGLALVGIALVQTVWIAVSFPMAAPALCLVWLGGFFCLFLLQPFVLRLPLEAGLPAWATAAVAGPVQLLLTQWVVRTVWAPEWMGLLPLPFLIPVGWAFEWVRRRSEPEAPGRLAALAWLGGSFLFLATAILPLQLHRHWLTMAWALEGLALCGLFLRLPHPGLRLSGLFLLLWSAGRLFTHPIVFGSAPRPDSGWNWFLGAYLVVIACCFGAARILTPPRDQVQGKSIRPILIVVGTLLAFLLLNLEIATIFGTGPNLTWEFSGNFARDLAYSIGWSLFAFALLLIGFLQSNRFSRYAALGLLGVTLLKLFLHDLSRLGPLHRIGAFAVVSVVAIVASFLYQRFQGKEAKAEPLV